MYATLLAGGQSVRHSFAAGRKGWLQVVRGRAEVNGMSVKAGDGVAVAPSGGDQPVTIASRDEAELLLFDMRP
jgi:redox-sensitive bicupin YhaK (pirin superfamily)